MHTRLHLHHLLALFIALGAGLRAAEPAAPTPSRGDDVRRYLTIEGGRYVAGGRAVWGGQSNGAWWKGSLDPAKAVELGGRSITRFVPAVEGAGLTEDLAQFAADITAAGMMHHTHIPGLWYDRRRDDHSREPRPDADVRAPFYEMPWLRSGEATAADGLSKYDLAKFNPWYFERLHEFARAGERHGLVFHNHLYNAHNLYETFAHWIDYPWRPENHINATGLPTPQRRDEGNSIHIADQVFDVSHPVRRDLHRAFIRHHLDVLGECPNVVHDVAFQFAGPLAFQDFFLDTVAEWERETGHDVKVALVTSRDITDAILADPTRAALVDVIDMRYWQRLADGTLWAPRGDLNLAFREQNARQFGRGLDSPPDTTPLAVYRGVREYRDRFPGKAITAWQGGVGPIPILMAGGAQALVRSPASGQSQKGESDASPFDAFVREHLTEALPRMHPRDGWLADPTRNWCLADDAGTHVLLYSLGDAEIVLARDLPATALAGLWFDPRAGQTTAATIPASLESGAIIAKPTSEDWLLFINITHPAMARREN